MAIIHFDIQEAFLDDLVTVTVNGKEVFRDRCRTRFQIGRAQACECEVLTTDLTYTVELPEKGLTASGQLALAAGELFFAVRLDNDKLSVIQSAEPFRYA